MSVLVINSSIRSDDSISKTLSLKLAKKLAEDKGLSIVERDTSKDMVFIDEDRFAAHGTALEDRTDEQNKLAHLSDQLIEELMNAEYIVLGTPVYNFGPPASLKAWADLVARAGTTFKYTENGPVGLLENKKAYLVGVSGGTPIGSDIDFMSPWVKFFLGFIGIHDVDVIKADGIMGADGEDKIQAAHTHIDQLAA